MTRNGHQSRNRGDQLDAVKERRRLIRSWARDIDESEPEEHDDPAVTAEIRRDALNSIIEDFLKQGYRISQPSDYGAQLLRPKRFSLFWSIALFLVFGV